MDQLFASVLSLVLRLQNVVVAFVLAAFLGAALRAFMRATLGDRLLPPRLRRARPAGRASALIRVGHLAWGASALALGSLYGIFVIGTLEWSVTAALVATFTALAIPGSLAVERFIGLRAPGGLTGALLRAVLVLSLAVLSLITLMRAGFLGLTRDRPVLLVELTGATSAEEVRWTPINGASRVERLVTHEVVFRRADDGARVGIAWVFGDEVAVKGRVLRLSPILNAAGIPNLFELQFAFNGYRTLERHNTYPHRAIAIDPVGPLAVHPFWHRFQERLLARWEAGVEPGSAWVIRSTTTESTYFPLRDAAQRPVKRTYRLVLTPGGLSAS
jgi:hypothetical protein